MRKLLWVACMALLCGCTTAKIPQYLADKHPYKKQFYANYDAALKAAKRHGRGVYALFPPGRKNDDVALLCDGYARIRGKHLAKCLLPDPMVAQDGTQLRCPAGWK